MFVIYTAYQIIQTANNVTGFACLLGPTRPIFQNELTLKNIVPNQSVFPHIGNTRKSNRFKI